MNEQLKQKIFEELSLIDSNTFYGLAEEEFLKKATALNYIIYGPAGFSKAGTSGTDIVDYFSVAIIRENFVPDKDRQNVIKSMIQIPGIRLADKDAESKYLRKGSTGILIEILVIYFSKARIGYIDAEC